MRLLVDQNLPPSLAQRLASAGHDVQHTHDLAMEKASDEDIFDWCRQYEAVLLTADKKLTKYLADQHASSPTVVIARDYILNFEQLAADLLAQLAGIEQTVAEHGHAVFSLRPDRPTRAQILPFLSPRE
ncbi:MAG: DUF5615 family PIN-like protein [Aeromicrobium sp.]|uniref:DUF5615 family PIN-like protein n=1 Tax=Aeromicrobium sp. TaxID=1871063 RepID=UPI0039E26267